METPDRFNIADVLLNENLAKRPDKPAVYYGDETLTYAGLYEKTNQFANSLRELANIRIGDTVMLVLPDSPEFFISLLGSMKAGAVPVLSNALLNDNDYRYMFNLSRAGTAVVSAPILESLRRILPELKHLRRVVVVGGDGTPDATRFEDMIRSGSAKAGAAETCRDDPAFWLWTSGTTGSPQAVVHLHHDILFTTEAFGKNILKIRDTDVCLSASKLFFAYGLGNSFSFPLRFGASTVLYPAKPTPEKLLELIDRHRATVFFAVPTIYNAMSKLEDDAIRRYDHGSLRLCASAGEALPASVWTGWKSKFGVEILDGIGTTEILHCFISNREGMVKPGSSGLPVPGYEVKLVDEEGNDVTEPGANGFLMVKGGSTTPYYWLNQERTKRTIIGDWIYTGDIFSKDADGFYWHQGRATDMLKPRGLWVSPVEVEAAILAHDAVFECAVVGVKDDAGLEKVKAFVVLKEGHAGSPELVASLKEFLKSRIDSYKVPQMVEFVVELPKTSTGKIRRFMLREKSSRQGPAPLTAAQSGMAEPARRGRGTEPGLVTMRYAHLMQICRYQTEGACLRESNNPHDCVETLCPLVEKFTT